GGMKLQRIPELLDFYGHEVMLLIGGDLLAARERLVEETKAYVTSVERYAYG
ncbi:MAG: ribulose 1,5-bisphosphate carboxylase, partial [Hyphomicrobiales bacterium]|nr:ribulose 1,5-bisphosphate carboxylase [Hyphomicrobiales bacterium]